LDLYDQYIAWLCSLNVEWSSEVMDLCQVDVAHVVCRVVVADLATGPVYAFDLYNLVVLDSSVRWVVWVPAVLSKAGE
jgi:hypothetical protein